jgi:hypothetical protein
MFSLVIALYFFFCLIVAFLGRKTELGFFKSLILSFVLTPILSIIIILIFYPVKISAIPKKYRERFEK